MLMDKELLTGQLHIKGCLKNSQTSLDQCKFISIYGSSVIFISHVFKISHMLKDQNYTFPKVMYRHGVISLYHALSF